MVHEAELKWLNQIGWDIVLLPHSSARLLYAQNCFVSDRIIIKGFVTHC